MLGTICPRTNNWSYLSGRNKNANNTALLTTDRLRTNRSYYRLHTSAASSLKKKKIPQPTSDQPKINPRIAARPLDELIRPLWAKSKGFQYIPHLAPAARVRHRRIGYQQIARAGSFRGIMVSLRFPPPGEVTTLRVVGPQFSDLFWPVACGLWDFFFLTLLAALVCKR
jgi:hypothetical protein